LRGLGIDSDRSFSAVRFGAAGCGSGVIARSRVGCPPFARSLDGSDITERGSSWIAGSSATISSPLVDRASLSREPSGNEARGACGAPGGVGPVSNPFFLRCRPPLPPPPLALPLVSPLATASSSRCLGLKLELAPYCCGVPWSSCAFVARSSRLAAPAPDVDARCWFADDDMLRAATLTPLSLPLSIVTEPRQAGTYCGPGLPAQEASGNPLRSDARVGQVPRQAVPHGSLVFADTTKSWSFPSPRVRSWLPLHQD
jgi:hypothetical protein